MLYRQVEMLVKVVQRVPAVVKLVQRVPGGGEAGTAGTGGGEAGTAGAGGGEAGTAGAGGGEAGTAGAGGGEAGTAGAGGGEAGSGGMVPCKDVDRDGECDDVDSLCNADGIPLACRRATPDCPPNTVPETRNGCFTDRCVTWMNVESWCLLIRLVAVSRASNVRTVSSAIIRSKRCVVRGICRGYVRLSSQTDRVPENCFGSVVVTGETYGNECEALRAGTSVASVGQCDSEPVSCGTRGTPPCADGNTATTLSMQVADEPIDQVSARHSTRKCRVP